MTSQHHPSTHTLLAHAAGTLDPALSLVVSVHLRDCAQCTREHLWDTAVGGAVMLAHDPAPMPPGLMERCLQSTKAQIAEIQQVTSDAQKTADTGNGISEPLLPHDLDGVAWKRLSRGIEQFVLPGFSHGRAWARLFRFRPGTVVPRHRHQGDEFVAVLRGAYLDKAIRFAAGDFAENDPAKIHELCIDGDEPCIALIASTGRINPDNFLYRAAFRFLGI